jgi:sterol 3beta-glucosyltransferase
MRLSFVAVGTRGDVAPLMLLAEATQSAGHQVRLITHPEFEPTARRLGLDFRAIGGSFESLLATTEGRRALGIPTNSPLGLSGLYNSFRPCAEAVFEECWNACADAEGLVTSAVAVPMVGLIASKRGLPLLMGLAVPGITSYQLPHPGLPPWNLGRLYNRLTYSAADLLMRRGAAAVFETWRRAATRLAPHGGGSSARTTMLVPVSPLLLPKPTDWPSDAHVTGFWFERSKPVTAIPHALRAFVEAGPAPICIGFGSMPEDQPAQLRAIVLDSLRRLGLRAVVVGGSGGALGGFDACDEIHELPFADYNWLFPRVRAVVHQGGVGTAAYCLTAGVPQVTVPYCLDHAFWASRLRHLGVTPGGIGRHRLTGPALAAKIRLAIEDPQYRRAAEAVAPRVRAEDGLGRAMQLLGEHFQIPITRAAVNA